MAVTDGSRYQLTDVVEVVGPTGLLTQPAFLDILQRVTTTNEGDRLLLIDASDDLAEIALRYLGEARAWWVIADLSGVVDPFTEVQAGKRFRVPSAARYQLQILSGGGT